MKGINDLMKQAQAMQEQMEKMRDEQKHAEHLGESGAGLVKVTLNGSYGVKSVTLDSALLDEEKEIIQDLIAAAFNDAVRKVNQGQQQGFSNLGAGLDLPKDFKFPF